MACVSELCGSIVKLELRSLDKVSKGYTSFRNNDVILAKITPCFENGKSAVVPKLKYGFGYGSTEFHVLRCGKLLDPRFLHVLVRQPKFIVQGRAVMTGAVGQQRVPRVFLENYPFPLPPIEEQREIVAYLDENLGKIDRVYDKLQEFLDQSDIRKDNLIQAGITGHLTSHWREEHKTEVSEDIELAEDSLVPEEEWPYPIPQHWKWVRLGAVIDLLSGRDAKLADCNDSGLGIPYVMGASNIRDSRLEIERWIEKPEVVSHAGDLLLTVKGTVGKLYIQIEPELNLSRQLMGLRPSAVISVSYLERVFSTHVQQLSAKAVGLIPGISRAHILNLAIPLPPIEEQKQIVALLENYLEKESAAKRLVLSAQNQLDLMRQQLVSAALAGRLTTVLR